MTKALYLQTLPGATIKRIEEILQSNGGKSHRVEYSQRTGTRIHHKTVSRKTSDDRAAGIKRSFAELWQLGFRMQDPTHLKQKHVDTLVKSWVEAGHSAAYIQTRASQLRVFCQWIGKPDLVRATDKICPESTAAVSRRQVASRSRSWKDYKVSSADLIQRAAALDTRFATMLELQAAFGLRVKESIEIHPAKVIGVEADTITIWEGTKGGRQRYVKADTPAQKAVLKNALVVSGSHPSGRLRWPGLTWRQAQNRFYHYCRQLGIRKSELGVTAHGLRHEYAQIQYRGLTGKVTPVEGGSASEINPALHRAASMAVSQLMGHARLGVTTAYYGSYGHQLRAPTRYTFSFQKGE